MKVGKINKNSGIYTITNLINGKIYVGCTVNFKNRYKTHLADLKKNKHHSIYLQRSWNKYGEENFIFEILEECEKDFLFSQENYWTQVLCTYNRNHGYNMKITHPLGKSTMDNKLKEILRKISSERNKGEKNYFYGKKGELSLMFGKCGEKHHNFGKKQSKEWIEKATKTRLKSIIQLDLNENFIKKWNSLAEASKNLNIKSPNISRSLKNIKTTSGGFKWKYKINENIS